MKQKRRKIGKFTALLALSGSALFFPLGSNAYHYESIIKVASAATTPSVQTESLQDAFKNAAKEFDVPESILLSVSYNLTRWENHDGNPSTSGGFGVMHLTQLNQVDLNEKGENDLSAIQLNKINDSEHTLDQAAALINLTPDALKKDPVQNIRGAAALLAQYAKETTDHIPSGEADWYGAVAKYSGSDESDTATSFADQVYETINQGVNHQTSDGQQVQLAPENVKSNHDTCERLHLHKHEKSLADAPKSVDSQFIPAFYEQLSADPEDYSNYDVADRPKFGPDIRYIVIHDTEVQYQPTINLFARPYGASANYVIRSSDGQITQMVDNKNVAWHAGNWYFNMHSIGIEHEGYALQGASWYSEQMYRASASLVRYLAKKYNIPLDRAHIIAHEEVPGLSPARQSSMHSDPGPFWDWEHYMELLGAPITPKHGSKDLVTIRPHFETNEQIVDVEDGNITAHPSNFIYLYTAPSLDAPMIKDPALMGARDYEALNWGNKAKTGQTFALADRQGDWNAIWYGGQKAWFYNPHNKNTVPGKKLTLLTPKAGKTSIPVYGSAYPESSAYPADITPKTITPLQYTITAGQVYAAEEKVKADYYNAKIFTNTPYGVHTMVVGNDEYYRIHFNHRYAFVKASDVDAVFR